MAESKPLVLLADDEEDIKTILQMYLEGCGYEVVTAFDGLDAIQKAQETVPSVILMDIMMPVIDGIEVTRQLKASPKTKHVPVIMLTAAAQSTMIQKAMEAGAVEYISKPFEPEQVKDVVDRFAKKKA